MNVSAPTGLFYSRNGAKRSPGGSRVEVCHFNGGYGFFRAFVAEISSRTVESLLQIFHCQHSEYDRRAPAGIKLGWRLRATIWHT